MKKNSKSRWISGILTAVLVLAAVFSPVGLATTGYAEDYEPGGDIQPRAGQIIIDRIDIVLNISDALYSALKNGGAVPSNYYYGNNMDNDGTSFTNVAPATQTITFHATNGKIYSGSELKNILSGSGWDLVYNYGLFEQAEIDNDTYNFTKQLQRGYTGTYYLGSDFWIWNGEKGDNKALAPVNFVSQTAQATLNVYIGEAKDACKVEEAYVFQAWGGYFGTDIPLGTVSQIETQVNKAHTHAWSTKLSETASHEVIVYCSSTANAGGCTYQSDKSKAKYVLKAEDMVYSGSVYDKAVLTSFNLPDEAKQSNTAISYYKVSESGQITNGEALASAPTDAGFYYAQITVGGTIAKKAFSITKASLTTAPTGKDLTYDRTEQELVNPGTATNGTVYYKVDGGAWSPDIPKATNASTGYTISYYVKGNPNYADDGSEGKPLGTVTVPIQPKALTEGMLTLGENEKYTGSPMTQTMAVKDGEAGLTLDDYTLSGDALTQTETGKYTVTIEGKGNYTGNITKEWEILGKDFLAGDFEFAGVKTVYDGENHSISVTNPTNLPGFHVTYSDAEDGTFVDTNPVFKNVTNQTVYFRVTAKGYSTVSGSATINITTKPVTITPNDNQSKIYGEQKEEYLFKAEGVVAGESLSGSLGRESGEGAGTYAFNLGTLVKENSNYTLTMAENAPKFTINPKPIKDFTATLDSADKCYAYTGREITPIVTLKDGENTLTLSTDYTIQNGSQTEVDSYALTLSGKGNYTDQLTVSWKIERAEIPTAITVATADYYYGGTVSTPASSGETPENAKATYYYRETADGVEGKAWSTLEADTLLPGTYYVYAEYPATKNYQAYTTAATPFKVLAKTIAEGEITAENVTVTYDGQPHGITVTPAGSLTTAAVKFGTVKGTYDLNVSPAFTNAGGPSTVYYQVTAKGCNPYEGWATVTIDKKAVTITPVAGQSKTYGEQDGTFRYTVTLIGTDALEGQLERVSGEDAKDYAFTLGSLDNDNYTLTLAENAPKFTINPKAVKLSWDGTERTYKEGEAQSVTATVTNPVGNDTIVLQYQDNEKTACGTYTAKAAELGNSNYTLTGGENVTHEWKILDKTLPTGTITFTESTLNRMLNKVTFGTFFKTVSAKIDAEDGIEGEQSGVDKVYYHVSETELTEAQVLALAENDWTKINNHGSFNLSDEKNYVVYAKITDKAENVSHVGSDGVVIDSTAPAVTVFDEENKETERTVFCDAVTIAVSDVNLKSVTLDGAEITLADGKYTIAIDKTKAERTIIAADKAGNETTVTLNIYDGHQWGEPTFLQKDGKTVAQYVCDHVETHIDIRDSEGDGSLIVTAEVQANAKLEGLTEELALELLTPEEKEMLEGEGDHKLVISLTSKDGAESQSDVQKVRSVEQDLITQMIASGAVKYAREVDTGVHFMDITLFKRVNENDPVSIPDAGKELTFTMPVPKDVQFPGAKYYVVRVHEGVSEILPSTLSGSGSDLYLTFKSQYFSTYAVLSVAEAEISVSISPETATITRGKTKTLKADVRVSGSINDKSVTWSSSDEKIATVDQNGKVKAIAPGKATITVTTNVQGKQASCVVTVVRPVDNNLLQTGQLKWPIPVLLILGLGCVACGVAVYRKKQGKYEA